MNGQTVGWDEPSFLENNNVRLHVGLRKRFGCAYLVGRTLLLDHYRTKTASQEPHIVGVGARGGGDRADGKERQCIEPSTKRAVAGSRYSEIEVDSEKVKSCRTGIVLKPGCYKHRMLC